MTRAALAALLAGVLVTGAAGPASAAPPDELEDVAKPCGGDGYEYGAYVYVPGRERPIPACVWPD